jgi:hypothetical protein
MSEMRSCRCQVRVDAIVIRCQVINHSAEPAVTGISSEKLVLPGHGVKSDDLYNRVALGKFAVDLGAPKLVQANYVCEVSSASEFR